MHHPLEDEEETRAYIEQCWAEIMNMYKKGINTKLVFNKKLEKELIEFQKECMPQDTLVGIIEMFLEMTDEEFVCVQMIYERALHHENCKPKQYESRDKNIKRAIDIVGNNNHYHPIIDKLESLEWDGKSRLRYLLPRYLGTDESDYIFEATRIMMMGAVYRVYHPGCKFEYMVCLVGGQGAGKSSFLRLLAMENEWFSDDLRKLDDDNVFRKIQGHWIIEMAEMLATCNARSVEDIKSFLSRQSETYKVPYETHPEDRPRQCIFVGSSNNADFLPFDRTGNRRFVPVMVNKEKALHHPLEDEEETRAYIEQCWAEIMNMYKKGINTKLVFNKKLEKELIEFQKECMPQDTLVGIIEMFLEMTDEEFVCVQMIYERALHHENCKPKQYESREITSIMRLKFAEQWEEVKSHRFIKEGYGTQLAWKRKKSKGFEKIEKNEDIPFKQETLENLKTESDEMAEKK